MIEAIVYVVDDDRDLAEAVARLLRRNGYAATPFVDPAHLLDGYSANPAHCVVTDIMMGDLDGFGFITRLREQDTGVAIVFMTAWPTTANAVDAIRRYGGLDYLEKPIDTARLLDAVAEGVAWSDRQRLAMARTDKLTPRERDVLNLLVMGKSNKMIAAELSLSPKTVETHRAAIMAKTETSGLAQLIALARL